MDAKVSKKSSRTKIPWRKLPRTETVTNLTAFFRLAVDICRRGKRIYEHLKGSLQRFNLPCENLQSGDSAARYSDIVKNKHQRKLSAETAWKPLTSHKLRNRLSRLIAAGI